MVGSANVVNSSLADRIQDTRGVRAQMQERLRQVRALGKSIYAGRVTLGV